MDNPLFRTDAYDYHLPPELISQTPSERRDGSRLMVVHRGDGSLEHRHFYDVIEYLNAGDVLVVNNSAVLPARLHGQRETTGAAIELLLLKRIETDEWDVMVRPGRRVKEGEWLSFGDGLLRALVLSRDESSGTRRVRFQYEGEFYALLDRLGEMPLPPYIKQRLEDSGRYQTVYAKQKGSAAAPTAGLHFTADLLAQLAQRGVVIVELMLHIGLGTFRPVAVEDIHHHHMHSEYFELSEQAAAAINTAKAQGRRVVAVGTTCVRVLESCAAQKNVVAARSGWTDIFLYPGVEFAIVDALITNFHLPKSTLLMLICAFGGYPLMMGAYEQAVAQHYRFFSFGDAMLIID